MLFEPHYLVDAFPTLLRGALVTLWMSLLAVVLGVVVGLALTLVRRARLGLLRALAATYISFARGTPLFVQILIVFYALPTVGLDIPRFHAGVVALSLNSGAYISEMIRGGLSAIPRGQVEAARALGMPRSLVWRHIILPQVFVLILPPLTAEFTALVKASALLSIIAVVELTRTAQQIIAGNFRPVEIWTGAGALYFVMCFALGAVTRRFERMAAAYRVV